MKSKVKKFGAVSEMEVVNGNRGKDVLTQRVEQCQQVGLHEYARSESCHFAENIRVVFAAVRFVGCRRG